MSCCWNNPRLPQGSQAEGRLPVVSSHGLLSGPWYRTAAAAVFQVTTQCGKGCVGGQSTANTRHKLVRPGESGGSYVCELPPSLPEASSLRLMQNPASLRHLC